MCKMLNVVLDLAGKVRVVCSLIVCGCHFRSNFVILLNVALESPVGLRLALILGSRRSASRTVLILFNDLAVRRLPGCPTFLFRLVPCVEYLAKFLKIVLVHGGCRSGRKPLFKTLNYPPWASYLIVL